MRRPNMIKASGDQTPLYLDNQTAKKAYLGEVKIGKEGAKYSGTGSMPAGTPVGKPSVLPEHVISENQSRIESAHAGKPVPSFTPSKISKPTTSAKMKPVDYARNVMTSAGHESAPSISSPKVGSTISMQSIASRPKTSPPPIPTAVFGGEKKSASMSGSADGMKKDFEGGEDEIKRFHAEFSKRKPIDFSKPGRKSERRQASKKKEERVFSKLEQMKDQSKNASMSGPPEGTLQAASAKAFKVLEKAANDQVKHYGKREGKKDPKGSLSRIRKYKTKSGKIKKPPKSEKAKKEMASEMIAHHMHHLGRHPGGEEQAIAIGLRQAGASNQDKSMKPNRDEEMWASDKYEKSRKQKECPECKSVLMDKPGHYECPKCPWKGTESEWMHQIKGNKKIKKSSRESSVFPFPSGGSGNQIAQHIHHHARGYKTSNTPGQKEYHRRELQTGLRAIAASARTNTKVVAEAAGIPHLHDEIMKPVPREERIKSGHEDPKHFERVERQIYGVKKPVITSVSVHKSLEDLMDISKAMTARAMPRYPRALRMQGEKDIFRSAMDIHTNRDPNIAKDIPTLSAGYLKPDTLLQLEKDEEERTHRNMHKSNELLNCGSCGRIFSKSFGECPTCTISKAAMCKAGHQMVKGRDGQLRCSICG